MKRRLFVITLLKGVKFRTRYKLSNLKSPVYMIFRLNNSLTFNMKLAIEARLELPREEGRKILAKLQVRRFIKASLEDFKPVHAMLKTLGENIGTYRYRVR